MKVGVLIPTRGDRPGFLEFAKKQMSKQTRLPDFIEIVDDPAIDQQKDITKRYRLGYQRLIDKGAEIIFFIEDDDWYSNSYIENMLVEWDKAGKPVIFGIGETYYYHLGVRAWFHMSHPPRASAYSTMITKIDNLTWPKDNEPFLDLHLWKTVQGKTTIFNKPITIGIKHGCGTYFGGIGHKSLGMFKRGDPDMVWLSHNIGDAETMEFYKKIGQNFRK